MSDPFIGQITIVAFNFPPRGWATCNGQILPINQNTALFSLLGTTYGGNGTTNFGLPNLQSRAPVHVGLGKSLGENGGEENHTLITAELPAHSHTVFGSANQATSSSPADNLLSEKARRGPNIYATAPGGSDVQPLASGTVSTTAGGQPHNNMQPYLALNFIIALQGIFPARN